MTRAEAAAIGVAVLGFLGGSFVAGRASKHCPAPAAIEAKREHHEEAWRAMVEDAQVRTNTVVTEGPERVVTRWLRPSGTVAKETTIERGPKVAATNTEAVTKVSETTKTVTVDVETVKIVTLPPQRYGIGLAGGIGLDGRRTWGVTGSYQLFKHVRTGIVVEPAERTVQAIFEVTF